MPRAVDRTTPRAQEDASIGARIAQLRKERGLTQKELAERLAVTQPVVSDYENDVIRIGSREGNHFRLTDSTVSRNHAEVLRLPDGIVLRDLGSHEGSVVNGIEVKDAVLHPGDQIAFEQHRFVLEAPGLPPRGSAAFAPAPRVGQGTTQTMQAVRAPLTPATPASASSTQEDAAPAKFNFWWLIGAAALIAAGLALIFLYGPR